MGSRRMLVAGLLTAASLAAPATADADTYRGYVSVGRGPTNTGFQGDGWTAVFRERAAGRVRYRVCLRHLDRPRVLRCWRRTTGSSGRSSVFAALFVNDRGGTGRWLARWRVGGRLVAAWRFRVRPESGG